MTQASSFFEEGNKAQNRKSVIFVEGMDDVKFLSHILHNMNESPADIGIVMAGSVGEIPSSLEGFLRTPFVTGGTTKCLSIICDADNDPSVIIRGIHDVLKVAGFPLPQSGCFLTSARGMRIGIFTMPAPKTPGDLECLCLSTVQQDPTYSAARQYVESAKARAEQSGKTLNGSIHKRIAQAYLAACPGHLSRGAGMGFAEGYFDAANECLKPLLSFLIQCRAA